MAKVLAVIGRLLLLAVLLVLIVVGGSNALAIMTTRGSIISLEAAAASESDCILVLGASVDPEGMPSPILRDRLLVGADLYFAGAAPKVIVSGDNREASYNEVAAMKRFLISQGVPSEDIFCDHAGYNTYDSMWRARHVFGVEKIVVVTQTYHEYRALFIAKGVGMEALGVASDLSEYDNQDFYDFREVLARLKDVWQVITGHSATVDSEPVSLDQSGDVTDW